MPATTGGTVYALLLLQRVEPPLRMPEGHVRAVRLVAHAARLPVWRWQRAAAEELLVCAALEVAQRVPEHERLVVVDDEEPLLRGTVTYMTTRAVRREDHPATVTAMAVVSRTFGRAAAYALCDAALGEFVGRTEDLLPARLASLSLYPPAPRRQTLVEVDLDETRDALHTAVRREVTLNDLLERTTGLSESAQRFRATAHRLNAWWCC
jgi:hypothetical protein